MLLEKGGRIRLKKLFLLSCPEKAVQLDNGLLSEWHRKATGKCGTAVRMGAGYSGPSTPSPTMLVVKLGFSLQCEGFIIKQQQRGRGLICHFLVLIKGYASVSEREDSANRLLPCVCLVGSCVPRVIPALPSRK